MNASNHADRRSESGLNPATSIHTLRPGIRFFYLSIAIIGLLGALIGLGVGGWRGYYALNTYGPAVLWRWIAPSLWAAGIASLIGLGGLILTLRTRNIKVQISPKEIAIEQRRKHIQIPWDALERIYTKSVNYEIFNMAWGRNVELTLLTRSGERIRINQPIDQPEVLIQKVKNHIYPRLLTAYRHAFSRGEPLAFDLFQLTAEGITQGKKVVKWEEIREVSLNHGRLHVFSFDKKHGPIINVPAHKIPNVDLCVQLMQHLGHLE
jgi:hypothetical protein